MEPYCKILPVRNDATGGDRKYVTLSISSEFAGFDNVKIKDLNFKLTKEDDPLFLYTRRMTEEDFEQLKEKQRLRVDFGKFSNELVRYLECVLAEDKNSNPTRYLVLKEVDIRNNSNCGQRRMAILEIVELNTLASTFPLRLELESASDQELHTYLSDCILNLKKRKTATEKHAHQMDNEFKRKAQKYAEDLQRKDKEIELLKQEHCRTISQLKSDFEKDREVKTATDQEQQQRCEQRCREMEQENEKLKSELNDLSHQVQSSRDECEFFKSENESLYEENGELQRAAENWKRMYDDLRADLAQMEAELQTKEDEIERCEREIEQVQQEKVTIEHFCDETQRRYEASLKRAQDELDIGVKVARRFQLKYEAGVSDFQKLKQEFEQQRCSVDEKGTFLRNKDTEIAKLRNENERLLAELEKLKIECHNLTEIANDIRQKFEAQTRAHDGSERMIHCLNQQLAEYRARLDNKSPFITPPALVPRNFEPVLGISPTLSNALAPKTPTSYFPGKENIPPHIHPKYLEKSSPTPTYTSRKV